jgi:cytochrome b subunit of formate dehydrogenase
MVRQEKTVAMQRFVSRERILRVDRIFKRFDLSHRIEHLVAALAVAALLVTGLPQLFAGWDVSATIIGWLGGINQARLIHRIAALVLMAEATYHALGTAYRFAVLRLPPHILLLPRDFGNLWQAIRFRLGRADEPPDMGRFTYQEKLLYWMAAWSVLILSATGLILWKPVVITRLLPGEIIPAAKAAHGSEALLLALAAVIWHAWHTLIRQRNLSIVTGSIAEETMLTEHPLEWDAIMKGIDRLPLDAGLMRKRRGKFVLIAAPILAAVAGGLWLYLGSGPTAIITHEEPLPIAERDSADSIHLPAPTSFTADPDLSWDGEIGELFGWRCGACHGDGDDLNLTRYDALLDSGLIARGDASGSLLVAMQARRDHAGQFTGEELAAIIVWINGGAAR